MTEAKRAGFGYPPNEKGYGARHALTVLLVYKPLLIILGAFPLRAFRAYFARFLAAFPKLCDFTHETALKVGAEDWARQQAALHNFDHQENKYAPPSPATLAKSIHLKAGQRAWQSCTQIVCPPKPGRSAPNSQDFVLYDLGYGARHLTRTSRRLRGRWS